MSNPKLSKKRWSGLSIAELLFFEKIGIVLSSGDPCGSMLQVAQRAGINYAHLFNALGRLESKVSIATKNQPFSQGGWGGCGFLIATFGLTD